jgi:hypothetical protein
MPGFLHHSRDRAKSASISEGGKIRMSTVAYEGSCLCGQIRVTLAAEPMTVALCHCIHCKKTGSSEFSMVLLSRAGDVQVEGKPSTYFDHGDSGSDVERTFCSNCGSPVETVSAGTRAGGIRIVKAGLFADRAAFAPSLEIFCVRRPQWLPALQGSATFEKMPPPP